MSVRIMADVWPLRLSLAQKVVLLKLADCASDDGCNAYPSAQTIADETCMTVRAVFNALKALKTYGLITIQRPGTQHTSTAYRIEASAVTAWPKSEDVRTQAKNITERGACLVSSYEPRSASYEPRSASYEPRAYDPSLTIKDPPEGASAPTPLAFPGIGEKPKARSRKGHDPIKRMTDREMAQLVAEYPDFDVDAELENCRNIATWETRYVAEYTALRNRLRMKRQERQEREERWQRPREPERVEVDVDPPWQPRQGMLA